MLLVTMSKAFKFQKVLETRKMFVLFQGNAVKLLEFKYQ